MNLLIKSVTILDPDSVFHKEKVDVHIKNGIFQEIADSISPSSQTEVLELENLHLSRGWFDSSISFGEPGYEQRETIRNGLDVAAQSGFTDIALQPNTNPVMDTSLAIRFAKEKASQHAVSLYPIGALSLGSKGKQLAELFDMRNAGAVAFGDYGKGIRDPNFLKTSLLYAQNFDGLLLSYPENTALAGSAMVHESVQSTLLGLQGIPSMAEAIQVSRDLQILEYTGGKLHIPTISTAAALEHIRSAKKQNLRISCSVAIPHLVLTDQALSNFNNLAKVRPPLREESDIRALKAAVHDGTIDMVTCDHLPATTEEKNLAFDQAAYGSLGLESAFGALHSAIGLDKTIEMLTSGKDFFDIKNFSIKIGNPVSISLFRPDISWEFGEAHLLSSCKNSAFLGKKMKGKAYGIFAKDSLVLAHV